MTISLHSVPSQSASWVVLKFDGISAASLGSWRMVEQIVRRQSALPPPAALAHRALFARDALPRGCDEQGRASTERLSEEETAA